LQKVVTLLLAGLIFSGCTVYRGERKSTPAKDYAKELSFNDVIKFNLTNADFSIQKAEIQYIEKGTEVNIIASVRHKSDNKYLVSLRTRAGIEIARIFISEDTLLLNDRINKKIYCGSPEYLEEKYGISIEALPLVFGDLIMERHREEPVLCKEGESRIMAVVATDSTGRLLPPCGRCRELMFQVNNKNLGTDVILSKSKITKLAKLLPNRWQDIYFSPPK